MADDTERAIEIVARTMRELPELYATRGHAFRVEFITTSDGAMLGVFNPEKAIWADDNG